MYEKAKGNKGPGEPIGINLNEPPTEDETANKGESSQQSQTGKQTQYVENPTTLDFLKAVEERKRKESISSEAGKNSYKYVTGYPTPIGTPSPSYGSQGNTKLAKITVYLGAAVALTVVSEGTAAVPALRIAAAAF